MCIDERLQPGYQVELVFGWGGICK